MMDLSLISKMAIVCFVGGYFVDGFITNSMGSYVIGWLLGGATVILLGGAD